MKFLVFKSRFTHDKITGQVWYKSPLVIILALIFIFPLGILLMWRFATWGKLTKTVITALWAVILALIIIFAPPGVTVKSSLKPTDDSSYLLKGTVSPANAVVSIDHKLTTRNGDIFEIQLALTEGDNNFIISAVDGSKKSEQKIRIHRYTSAEIAKRQAEEATKKKTEEDKKKAAQEKAQQEEIKKAEEDKKKQDNAKKQSSQSSQNNQTKAPALKAAYSAKITNSVPLNPATLRFYSQVTNTGNGAGTPDCTVNAKDVSGTYHGFDYFTLDPIQPGATLTWNGTLTITKEGSYYVTSVTISCS